MTSPVTTHVLDVAIGKPAAGVTTTLERWSAGKWSLVGKQQTDADGRAKGLWLEGRLETGGYRLTFEVGAYFAAQGRKSLFKTIPIEFLVEDAAAHYHVPLLVSPFGYSTYRGS